MAQRNIGMNPASHSPETVSIADADTRQWPSATDDSMIAPERLLALFAAKDLDALIDTAFDVLRAAVECDFASAFYRSTGDGLLKERDSRGRQSGAAFMRRYVELTPALPIARANRGISVLSTRTILPGIAELRKTAFYREIMQPQGWRHAVSLCFWGDPPAEAPIFVTSAYRREGRSDFSDLEIARLARIHPFLDCAVNRLNEREAAKTVRDGIAMAVRDGTPGFAILDRNLLLVEANPVARQLCAAWEEDAVPTDTESSSPAWHLPPELQAACRDLHHEWQSLLRADPDATGIRRDRPVAHPRVPGLTAWITLVCPKTANLGEPTFVLELDRRVHGVTLDTPDRAAPILQKMTASERAVAMILADGFSNQEIADQLGKTVDAVKFLLHRIYQKTGIPNRAALVAVLRARPNRRSRSQRKRG
jgi:DNA-binding CsgD family transcriptional regulator